MSKIQLNKINKYFDNNHVLKDIDLEVEDGEFMTLLGPSGCGKTTTLRVIAGLENPEHGEVYIGGKKVVDGDSKHYVPSAKRELNLVFQSYALWPHMTVFENVAFGLNIKQMDKSKIKSKVEDALDRMQIRNLIDRYPSELSGGQQQRVAISRAIVTQPKVLLLDEPLSNLDAKLRLEMRAELKRLHQDFKTTIIYVTHDQVEALTLSTRIAIFFEGELVQVDTPYNLYKKPIDLRVADFIGNPAINFVHALGTYDSNLINLNSPIGKFQFKSSNKPSTNEFVLSIRPEDIIIQSSPMEEGIKGRIYSVLPAGSETLIQISINETILLVKVIGDVDYPMGSEIWAKFSPHKMNLYDKKTEKIIPLIE